jgi:toluene monooxygenase system ferredoxin subunit
MASGTDRNDAGRNGFVPVARIGELPRGGKLGRVVSGTRILLVHLKGGIHAYEDRCAHRDVPLCEGTLDGSVLTCRAHDWQYDAGTGCGIDRPGVRLRRYPMQIEGSHILVDLDGAL